MKQRIIGALVLISLAVIFVPMMFDKPHDERAVRTLDIPEEPPFPEVSAPQGDDRISGVPEYRVEELDPVSPPGQTGDAVETPAAETASVQDAMVDESDSAGGLADVDEPGPAPAETSAPVQQTGSQSASAGSAAEVSSAPESQDSEFQRTLDGAWVLQLGSFGNEENARRLRDSVRERGYGAHLQEVTRGDQQLVRVFSGPFTRREDAEQAKTELDKAFQIKSLVTQGGD